jgi:hypothetical protein
MLPACMLAQTRKCFQACWPVAVEPVRLVSALDCRRPVGLHPNGVSSLAPPRASNGPEPWSACELFGRHWWGLIIIEALAEAASLRLPREAASWASHARSSRARPSSEWDRIASLPLHVG